MLNWLCVKNQGRHFGLIQHWCAWFCCNSVRIPLKFWSGMISSIILSAYMFSLLPVKGGWAGGDTTDIETPTFPSKDKVSCPDPHHFQLPPQLPQHWKQNCDGSFKFSSVYGLYFRIYQHKRLSTLYDQTIRLQGGHSCPILLKHPKWTGTAGELPLSWRRRAWMTSAVEHLVLRQRHEHWLPKQPWKPEVQKWKVIPFQQVFWAQWNYL